MTHRWHGRSLGRVAPNLSRSTSVLRRTRYRAHGGQRWRFGWGKCLGPFTLSVQVSTSGGYRMGALCTESAIVVFGLLSTSTIAKSAITSGDTDVNAFPSLRWRSAGERRRWTPIIAF